MLGLGDGKRWEKGQSIFLCWGKNVTRICVYVYVQSEGMAGLYHRPWLSEAEMQLNGKVLWKDRGREGLSESALALEKWL